jgi:aldose 1-epimerase
LFQIINMFRINTYGGDTSWAVYQLEDMVQDMRIEVVPSAGGILNAWWVGGINIIEGYTDREDFAERVHAGFRSAKLLPFVCRLNNAAYRWQEQTYILDKFLLNGSALHGIVYDQVFAVVEAQQDKSGCSVELEYRYAGEHPGYPFPFTCKIRYALSADGKLEIATWLTNPDSAASALPIVDGWHPYFALGGEADHWLLKITTDQMMEYNDALIPTGRYLRDSTFTEGALIGDTKLDNGFLLSGTLGPFCKLKNLETGHTVTFLRQLNYPFLQLYIPDHRKSIAIENLSGAPDAFNNGIGLTVLQPGEQKAFLVEIQATVKP